MAQETKAVSGPKSEPEIEALKERFQTSYWDAAIFASAKAARCQQLLSEDLTHGQDYDGVGVVNPFFPQRQPPH